MQAGCSEFQCAPLGYAFVIPQGGNADETYPLDVGFDRGTMFKALDLPYGVYGIINTGGALCRREI